MQAIVFSLVSLKNCWFMGKMLLGYYRIMGKMLLEYYRIMVKYYFDTIELWVKYNVVVPGDTFFALLLERYLRRLPIILVLELNLNIHDTAFHTANLKHPGKNPNNEDIFSLKKCTSNSL
jgi:hypothetical protein